jgi:hypothetical protein
MRPQGVVGALAAITVGAILTYAVSFTASGINIHTVGVIIMLAGAAALVILLVRAVGGRRGPSSDGGYPQDPLRGAPPVAATRIPTDVYGPPARQAEEPLPNAGLYRTHGTPRR